MFQVFYHKMKIFLHNYNYYNNDELNDLQYIVLFHPIFGRHINCGKHFFPYVRIFQYILYKLKLN